MEKRSIELLSVKRLDFELLSIKGCVMYRKILVGLLGVSCFSFVANAQQDTEPSSSFIQVNVGLDLQGVEQSLNDTNKSLDSLAASLHLMATNAELTPEQQQSIETTVESVNHLIDISAASIEGLPSAFADSKQIVAQKTQHFLDDLTYKILLIVGVTIAILIAAILGVYWLTLRPMLSTIFGATRNISDMAKALQVTAQAVEASTDKQQLIMQQLQDKTTN